MLSAVAKVEQVRLEGVSLRKVRGWSAAELSRRTHVPELEVRPILDRFVALGILLEIAPGEYAMPAGHDDEADALSFLEDE